MKKNKDTIKIVILIFLGLAFLFFLVIYPMIIFSKNEKLLLNAGKHYFELNPNELPTGDRVKTVSLNTLYRKSYMKSDLYIPYTNKLCSIEHSWVKIRKENGNYRYYTYLECGLLSSNIDHKGPSIELYGEKEIVIGKGEEFIDPGVKSVIDSRDGKIDVSTVEVKNLVDTQKVGSYTISYIAYDELKNKTEVKRSVKVVQKLYYTMKEALKDSMNFKGNPNNNYIKLSNMIFRVFGVDSNNNVIIVSDEDIANVNYTKIDKWLEYYYEHLNEGTKNMIVQAKYCNERLSEEALDTVICNSYTKKKKIYIPSIMDINLAEKDGVNFMKPYTLSWVSNTKNSEEAYLTRNVFYADEYGKKYVFDKTMYNFGVRPMMTIVGDSLITGGVGTYDDPYIFGDSKPVKNGSYINTRASGEYVSINGIVYRIIDVMKDGTTKVILEGIVGNSERDVTCSANTNSNKIVYDPTDKESVAYFINNRLSEYLDTSLFVNREVEVPIYKDNIIYGEEVAFNKVKVKLSAPNMYDMFSAQPQRNGVKGSYWLINSSKKDRITGLIYRAGAPYNDVSVSYFLQLNLRVVGYLNRNTVIGSGLGTYENPYLLR